jgi:hypothetical protein
MLTNSKGEEIGMYWRRTPEKLTWQKLGKGMSVCHQSFIIRKSLADDYDFQYPVSADFDWIIKGLKKSNKIVNTNLILSKFLIGGISKKREFQTWVENYHLLKNHFGFWRNLANHFYMAATRPGRMKIQPVRLPKRNNY